MKRKAQKKCKQKVNYKPTVGVIKSYTYRDYKTHEIRTRYYGYQERRKNNESNNDEH